MKTLEISFPSAQIEDQIIMFQQFINSSDLNEDFTITPKEQETEKGTMGIGLLTGEVLLKIKDIGIGLIGAIASYASVTRQKVIIKHGETEATFEGKDVNELMKQAAVFINKIELAKQNAKS